MSDVSAESRPGSDREAFDRFLLSLDPNRERAGEAYETIRRKLIKYFQWRECFFPEDQADEVLQRMVGKFARGEQIQNPSTYCFGIARLLLLELHKERGRERAAAEELRYSESFVTDDDQGQVLGCLDRCLKTLPPEHSRLILGYYEEDRGAKIERRQLLAKELSIPLNALRIRALRLREKLEECMQGCLQTNAA